MVDIMETTNEYNQAQAKFKINETEGSYTVQGEITDTDILVMAEIISKKKFIKGELLVSTTCTKLCLRNLMKGYEREVFGVLFLDTKHYVIKFEELFWGTIDNATVHPREIIKAAILCNAAAIILVHNHPSGDPEPSVSDRKITTRIVEAMDLVDIRVLDHIVVGENGAVSFVDRGYL